MKNKNYICILLVTLVGVFLATYLVLVATKPRHSLVGSWLASDKTIFSIRSNGTFVGKDMRGQLIWGNWVEIDKDRIGFQSLLHKTYYAPQFAVLTPKGMQYAASDSDWFIRATRITDSEAQAGIASATPLLTPNSDETADGTGKPATRPESDSKGGD